MSKIFFSASENGFFSPGLHPQLPSDAVEISSAEHKAMLEGQSIGGRIVADTDGKPQLAFDNVEASLSAIKSSLKGQIDSLAENERLKYITPGAGQAMTYQQKVDEARAFKNASSPNAADYPVLSSEVGITAETLSEVADVVLAAFAQWQQIGAAIEAVRLGAKRDIDAAADEAAARVIVDTIEWPQPAL